MRYRSTEYQYCVLTYPPIGAPCQDFFYGPVSGAVFGLLSACPCPHACIAPCALTLFPDDSLFVTPALAPPPHGSLGAPPLAALAGSGRITLTSLFGMHPFPESPVSCRATRPPSPNR